MRLWKSSQLEMLAVVFVDEIMFTFLGKDPRILLAKVIIHVSFIL